jgi:hypothetical protein
MRALLSFFFYFFTSSRARADISNERGQQTHK